MRRSLPLLASLLALLAVGQAIAQCSPGPGISVVSIEGFGAAYYHDLRTDRAHDEVEFYGGVCVAGEGAVWVVEADRVVVSGLRGTLALQAADATLRVEGWTLSAASLDATRERLDLRSVRLRGADAGGRAETVALDLTTGAVRLTSVTLEGAAFVVRGDRASLQDSGLRLEGASLTTCSCPGTPFYAVDAAEAVADVNARAVTLRRASLRIASRTIPLGQDLTLDEPGLAALRLPLEVRYTADDPAQGIAGAGLEVLLTDLPIADGATVDAGAAGLDQDYPLVGVALLHAREGGARLTVGRQAEGGVFELTTDTALAPGWTAGFDTRVSGPRVRDGLREGVVHVSGSTPVPALRGRVVARAEAAASAQEPENDPAVAAPRLALSVDGVARTIDTVAGTGSLGIHAEASAYPTRGAGQWGVRLTPSWRLEEDEVRATARYTAQWTNGGSPFTTALDKLEPRQRLDLQLERVASSAPGWSAGGSLAVRYDLVGGEGFGPGLNRLDPSASIGYRAGGWEMRLQGDAALAGVLAPDGERDGTLALAVTARRAGLELGTRVRWRWQPDPVGFEAWEWEAAVPIEAPGVELRPYLSLDVAPSLLHGAWPSVAGHGLDVTFVTCCGSVTVGYRDRDGQWSATFAVDLARKRVPPDGVACPSAGADGVLAVDGSDAGTCRADVPDPAGIMAPAAPLRASAPP